MLPITAGARGREGGGGPAPERNGMEKGGMEQKGEEGEQYPSSIWFNTT